MRHICQPVSGFSTVEWQQVDARRVLPLLIRTQSSSNTADASLSHIQEPPMCSRSPHAAATGVALFCAGWSYSLALRCNLNLGPCAESKGTYTPVSFACWMSTANSNCGWQTRQNSGSAIESTTGTVAN